MTCNATIPIRSTSYDGDRIQLFLGDCRDLISHLPKPDLVLTDPPYGMGYYPRRGGRGSKRWTNQLIVGDDEPFDPAHLLALGRCVLWGGNWYADKLPTSGGWLVWDKTPKGHKQGFNASHAELAWTNCCSSVRKFSLQWGGEARNGEACLHPTQKPVALMRWVVEQFTSECDLVLDPYMGSGPVAQACRELRATECPHCAAPLVLPQGSGRDHVALFVLVAVGICAIVVALGFVRWQGIEQERAEEQKHRDAVALAARVKAQLKRETEDSAERHKAIQLRTERDVQQTWKAVQDAAQSWQYEMEEQNRQFERDRKIALKRFQADASGRAKKANIEGELAINRRFDEIAATNTAAHIELQKRVFDEHRQRMLEEEQDLKNALRAYTKDTATKR